MRLKICLAHADTPFSIRTLLGAKGADILSESFPDARFEPLPDGVDGALIYDDTPLVTPDRVAQTAARLMDAGGGIAPVGKGFIRVGNSDIRYPIYELWATKINNDADFCAVERALRDEVVARLEGCGARIIDPFSTRIGWRVKAGAGTVIHPFCVLSGDTVLGENVTVFSFCDLTDVTVGAGSDVRSTFATGALIGAHCTVGPFTCLRKGTVVGDGCCVGDYVEIKNSVLGNGVKAAHLAYVGDSTVGEGTNIGCGAVFANYDGKVKRGVTVGKGVFIGCNANLVAPITVEDGAYIAAGSTVTEDVPGGTLCIARARQVHKMKKR